MLKTACRVAMCMAVSLSGFAQGQTPQAINYQASVRDNAGALLSNQELDVQFEIIQGADAASGTVVYSELHSDITTNAFGIFSLEIGNGAPQSGTMAGVSWSADKSFLRVKIDDDNDGNFDELTAQQLVSVPYSLSSENALNINGYPVGATSPAVGQVLKWDGSAWVPDTDDTSGGGGTGDITSVTVVSGGGLTGGGLSGDVVLDADNTNAMWNADQIQGTAVDATLAPNSGEVLKWDGTNWTAAQDDVGTGGSGDITEVNTAPPLAGGSTSGIVNLTVANSSAVWNANSLRGTALADPMNPSSGQVLKWNGTSWAAAQDDVGSGGSSPWTVTGNNIDYAVPGGFVGIGVANPAYKLDVAGQARFGGNVIGTGNITAGSLTTTGNFTLSGDILLNHPIPASGGWIRGFTYRDASANIDAGFGLLGSGPNPTKLYMGHGATPWSTANGISILPNGNVGIGVISPLKEFHVDADTVRISSLNTSGSNQMLVIEPDGDVITQAIPVAGGGDITAVNTTYPLGGGVTSGVANLSVDNSAAQWNASELQSKGISTVAPTNGQVLKFNSSANIWQPAVDNSNIGDITGVTAGTGLSNGGVTGNVTINARTTEALWNANKLRDNPISATAPNTGQVLKWDGTNWAPAVDETGAGGGAITNITGQNGIQVAGAAPSVIVAAQNTSAMWNANQLQGRQIWAGAAQDGQVLAWDSWINAWAPTTVQGGGGGDDLGDHVADQNLNLGTNYLSPDGGSVGIRFEQINTSEERIAMSVTNSENPNKLYITQYGVGVGGFASTNYVFYSNSHAYVDGDLYVLGQFQNPSDIRFKKDINRIISPLQQIDRLNGYTYRWNTEEFPERKFREGREYGFIAQELELLFPLLVTTMDDGYKAVDYTKITPVLVEAIKELHALVQTQQEALDASRQERAQLQEQIDLIMQQTGLNSKAEK